MTAEQLGEAIDTVREYLLFIDPDEELNKIVEHIAKLEAELAEAREFIFDLFLQGCLLPNDTYNHQYISAYEHAQTYLIVHGIITQEQCDYR